MVEKLVYDTIEKNGLIDKGDHVIIGLSGGPDSVCLFYCLLKLKDEYGFYMQAVHVNHMLRPQDADKDQEYVEAICRESNTDCKSIARDCAKIAREQGATDEEAGRGLRYAAFYEAAEELIKSGVSAGNVKIAVAQNRNDQAETVLMRIIRGTGVNGLSGISYKRQGEHGTWVIRPLLDVSRAEIESYCMENSLNPRIDHTNAQPIYTRNKIRLDLMPYLSANFNEGIAGALVRLSASAREDNLCLWKQAMLVFTRIRKRPDETGAFTWAGKVVLLDRDGLRRTDPAIRHRILIAAFQEIGLRQDITAHHFSMMDDITFGGGASAVVCLPGGYRMAVSYGYAALYIDIEKGQAEDELRGKFMLKKSILHIDGYKALEMPQTGNLYAAFDFGRLKVKAEGAADRLELRSRQQGDFFTPSGMKSGKKKIQDYFVDRKIPRSERGRYMLVCVGNEAIWVFDPLSGKHGDVSEKYKLTRDAKEVLLLEISSEM